jgi:CheY-like chemotaxis protein
MNTMRHHSEGGGAAVLVVDDDQSVRETLTEVLQLQGFEVAGASNGKEALDYLHDQPPPCLILLDLNMPGVDGWQFRAAQKKDPHIAEVPVVAVSALNYPSNLDVSDFIRKPVDLDHLLDVISHYC